MYGTIKKIVKDKGFGFIVPDDGSDDVFFHRSRMAPKVNFEDLREGEEVEFQVHKGDKGPQAFNLKPGERPGPRCACATAPRADPARWRRALRPRRDRERVRDEPRAARFVHLGPAPGRSPAC